MELITIDSHDKYESVLEVLAQSKISEKWVWTSGTDLGSENNFFWTTTGKSFEYGIWHDNQPDNSGENENCVELSDWGDSYKFNDKDCNGKIFFVCNSITYDVHCYWNINV